MTLFCGVLYCIFQQDNANPHAASITTALLCSKGARVLNWLLAAVRTFRQLKTFGAS